MSVIGRIITGLRKRRLSRLLLWIVGGKTGGVIIAEVIVVVVFYVLTEGRILTARNIFRLLRQTAELGIMAEAIAILMISKEFDLSSESYVALTPLVAIVVMQSTGISIWLAVPLSIGLAALLGMVNGLIVTKSRIPSFIVTLGTMWIYRGISLVLSHGWPQRMPPTTFSFIMAGTVGDFPLPAVILAITSLLFWFLLHHTAYGNKVYATGGNETAAVSVGINTHKIKIINFAIVAVVSSLTGFMSGSYVGSLNPLLGQGMALEAIAAAVIGGCSLFGGAGTILGVLLGAFLLAIIRSGLVLLGVSAYWQNLSVGVAVIITVILNRRFAQKS